LLGFLIYESGAMRIAADLQSVGRGLIAIIAIEFMVDGFHTLGWWFTFSAEARRGYYWTLYFVRLAGTALNQTIPAASMGGEPAKVFLLEPHFPVTTAIATVMTSSLVMSLSKAGFIAFGTILTWRRVQLPHGFVIAVVVGFVATLAGILVFLIFQLRGITAAAKGVIARLPLPDRWIQGLERLAPSIDEEIRAFYRTRPRDLTMAVLAHLCAFCCGVVQVWLLIGWLGLPRSLATSLAIESFSMLLGFMMFAVPGSIGVQEGGMLLVFAALGLPASAGLAVGIAFRVTSIVGAAAGLLAFAALKGRKVQELVDG
jgi:glycosyltransferase 2 family protein